MEYFRILNLRKEPFSNSPDPEFSFRSQQHTICLSRLELSIRFRRGLDVVLGEVGTGKTTLCRQLIRKVADDDTIETHLILDPCFSTPQEFLLTISGMFGFDKGSTEYSSWQLKEYIKNYLFKKGIDEQKIVALLIDEGQKLPDFCVEILREFLNYETNAYKLLQTIIFAQKEFQQTIDAYPNFADRINLYHVLEGMSFRETRQMIYYRLNQAKEGYKPPELFSFLGLLAVYRVTGGYPRKVVHLCHRVLLTLIIRNKSKAGWSLVWWCARMLYPTRVTSTLRSTARSTAAALAFALVLILGGATLTGQWKLPSFPGSGMMAPAAKVGDSSAPALESGAPVQTPVHSRTQTGKISLSVLPHAVSSPAPEATLPPQPVLPNGSSPEEKPVAEESPKEEAAPQALHPESPQAQASDPQPAALPVQEAQANGREAVAQPSESMTPESEPVKESLSSKMADSQAVEPQEAREVVSPATVPSVPAFVPLPEAKEMPATLGMLCVKRNEPLAKMIRRIYGTFDPEHLKYVIEANPALKDGNRIPFGKSICFPAIPVKAAPQRGCWYVQVAEKENLEDAYEFSGYTFSGGIPLRLIPYWDRQKGLRFSVILNRCFNTFEAAQKMIRNLPSFFAGIPLNMASRQSDTVFFSR